MKDLIKRMRKGDEDIFKKLTVQFKDDLYRVARARLKNIDDINDAMQNTMIITYNNINKIKNEKHFKYWMIRVLINECNKIYNSNKKSVALYSKVLANNAYEESYYPTHDINSKLDFEKFLDNLNYDEKIVVTLHYNSQYSCTEIAKLLNANVNTIKSRLLRGKEKLKEFYKEVDNNANE